MVSLTHATSAASVRVSKSGRRSGTDFESREGIATQDLGNAVTFSLFFSTVVPVCKGARMFGSTTVYNIDHRATSAIHLLLHARLPAEQSARHREMAPSDPPKDLVDKYDWPSYNLLDL